jgi:hypothetical protein
VGRPFGPRLRNNSAGHCQTQPPRPKARARSAGARAQSAGGRRLKCGKVFRERARKEGRDGDALARWGDVRRWILTGDSSVAAETGEVGN